MIRWILPVACMWLPPAITVAQELGDKEAGEVRRLVEQMGDDDFKQRQLASAELMKRVERNPGFAKHLQRFAKHEDPEIRFRISELTKDLPVVLQWMDPSREKELKSQLGSPGKLRLTINNRSKDKIAVYWIDWNGKRQARGELKPGEKRTIAKTYVGHYWLIADSAGQGLGVYVATQIRDAQIVFIGDMSKQGKEAK